MSHLVKVVFSVPGDVDTETALLPIERIRSIGGIVPDLLEHAHVERKNAEEGGGAFDIILVRCEMAGLRPALLAVNIRLAYRPRDWERVMAHVPERGDPVRFKPASFRVIFDLDGVSGLTDGDKGWIDEYLDLSMQKVMAEYAFCYPGCVQIGTLLEIIHGLNYLGVDDGRLLALFMCLLAKTLRVGDFQRTTKEIACLSTCTLRRSYYNVQDLHNAKAVLELTSEYVEEEALE
jgi:hypothetical protein